MKLIVCGLLACAAALSNSGRDSLASADQSKSTHRNVWRDLRPLYSSRKDVERTLGANPVVRGARNFYEEAKETISIRYVRETCESKAAIWNVPIDTVEEIEVVPMTTVLPTELKFDLNQFRKIEMQHPKNVFRYWHPDGGVEITTRLIHTKLQGDREEVMFVRYGPMGEEDLRCPNRPL